MHIAIFDWVVVVVVVVAFPRLRGLWENVRQVIPRLRFFFFFFFLKWRLARAH